MNIITDTRNTYLARVGEVLSTRAGRTVRLQAHGPKCEEGIVVIGDDAPIDVGLGGWWQGTRHEAERDVASGCWDHVLALLARPTA